VQRVDGHDLRQIRNAVHIAQTASGAPHLIVADTVKGKGVSFMEDEPDWHSQTIGQEHYRVAMSDLDAIGRRLAEESRE
jgi:transketolase